jgi:protein tyrosine phosphatase (PTP) superfamily phosphohydrolase (DUF442 family)
MDILNQYHVTENIASSGQPDEAQIEQIASEGYYAVINLAMPDHKNSLANEGSIVSSLGMTYIHIPVPFEAPNEDHLVTFSGYMDALETKKVWVHCIVNARVSAFLFRYLQKNRGWSAEKSATPILEQWLPDMDVVWKDFISLAPEQL